MLFAEDFHHQIEMAFHHDNALFESRFGREFTCCEVVRGVAEDPRVVERAASDADRRAAGLVEHHFGSLRRRDIAVADDRHASHRLHDRADAAEVH